MPSGSQIAAGIGAIPLLVVRGLLMWLVLPFATLIWILLFPWFLHRKVGFWLFLGWADLNLIAALQATLFRPFFSEERTAFVRFTDIKAVRHRIDFLGPARPG